LVVGPFRFHVLGIPHTVTTPEYSTCAFTQKIVKLCKLLRARGHHVIHYGNADSVVDCDEHVTVTTADELDRSYPSHDWRTLGFPAFTLEDPIHATFNANTIAAVEARKRRNDFLLCSFGAGHKAVAAAHADMIVVEPGIGYPGGTFAPFKVFESYAVMHAMQGPERIGAMSNAMWYDAVIPNYFDPEDFRLEPVKSDYFLFLGRLGEGKGSHIAADIAARVGARLVVAGMGEIEASPHVVRVGVVGPAKRKELLSHARGTICASTYLEPFCGVQIESMLSGTPVISTDWGAFAEYNLHGVTGYRCRTMEQFVWAARNIDEIDPLACRAWAERNFSLRRAGEMFDEYFSSVMNVFTGAGFYEPNPERTNLDWLNRHYPA
jgi:glycosyltransferase involved in cell wall biosynthesis